VIATTPSPIAATLGTDICILSVEVAKTTIGQIVAYELGRLEMQVGLKAGRIREATVRAVTEQIITRINALDPVTICQPRPLQG
jgi:hypothetical protein